jgi:hypothetical protein
VTRINHLDDADLKTLRNIMHRLYDDGISLTRGDRRDLAHVMLLILDRVETAEAEIKEPEHG